MELSDYKVFIFFIAFWIFSFLSKKLTKKNKGSTKKGFTFRLLQYLAQYRENSSNNLNKPGSSPQQVPVAPKVEKPIPYSTASNSPAKNHAKPSLNSVKKVVTAATVERRYTQDDILPKSSFMPANKKKVRNRFTKQKMRHAIVWSEILSPPVSLRDN